MSSLPPYLKWIFPQAFAAGLVFTVLAPYFSSLGYSDYVVALLMGIFPLIVGIACALVGELTVKIGRTWLLKLALVGSVCAYLLYTVDSLVVLFVARSLDAVSFAFLNVVMLSKAQSSPQSTSGRRVGLYLSLQYIARLVAPIVAGGLASVNVRFVFYFAIVCLTLLFFTLKDVRFHRKSNEIPLNLFHGIIDLWKNPQTKAFCVLGPAMNLLAPLTQIFIPLYIVNSLGLGYAEVGLTVAVMGIAHVLQYFIGELCDIVWSGYLIILGISIMGLSLLVLSLADPSFVGLLWILFFYGLGGAVWNVSAWTYLGDAARGNTGSVTGSYGAIAHVASGIAGLSLGWLAVSFSLHVVVGVALAVSCAMACWGCVLLVNSRKFSKVI